jgi:putative glutamine amidotransferase
MSRPLIGVTTSEVRRGSSTHPLPEADPPQPELALGLAYLRAVEGAGGIPVVLSPLADPAAIDALMGHLAGVCLSGGPDLDPSNYGAEAEPDLGPTEPELDLFELSVARRADAHGLPILGICRGAQALNVARGGSLIQHLPAFTDGTVDHRQSVSGRLTSHPVRIEPGSQLARIVGREQIDVNSFHHQSTDVLGAGLRPVAWAPDGVVEAVEGAPDTRGGLLLGVQWHAETLTEIPEHHALFEALVDAAVAGHVARELVA